MKTIYDFEVKTIDGQLKLLKEYEGKVLLIVNVASKCGFTSQYDGLEQLYQKYRSRGLVILGFPCNQFKNQEPGSEQDIKDFCRLTYGVSFDMFAKIEVNGENVHPLYTHLKEECPGLLGSRTIKWNFTKFLVDANGMVRNRFAPATEPVDLKDYIVQLLPGNA